MNLQERMVIEEQATGLRFRVCLINPMDTWLMPLQGSDWPVAESTQVANKRYRSGEYVDIEGTDKLTRTAGAADHGNATYDRFAPYLGDTLKFMSSAGRASIFREMKKSCPDLSKGTYYINIRKWLKGGCIPLALAAEWRSVTPSVDLTDIASMSLAAATRTAQAQSEKLMLAAHTPAKRSDHTVKGLARKRRQLTDKTMFVVDRAAVRLFSDYYGDIKQGRSVPMLYKEMCRAVFSTRSPLGDITMWPRWAVPSFNQFKDWYYRLTSHRQRQENAKGAHAFKLSGRSREGQGVSAAYTAGSIGSADATVWNVELVSDLPGADLIGPPVVFRIRDKDSGMLFGLGVSLENASWNGMASAIANCTEDKVKFCARYGIPISAEDWQVRGLPASIEADCGETDNLKPNRFVALTKCELINLPPARGDLKPGVESDFNTLQVHLNGRTPGAIIKQYEDKTHDQWRLEGCMTLDAFMRNLILEELKRMHRPRPQLQLPTQMVADGVDSSPHSMFNWSVENGGGGLRRFDEDQIRLSLLDTEKASITPEGVLVKGLRYLGPELKMAQAMEHARRHGRRSIDIAFDPRLVNHVYILHGDKDRPTGYTQCTLNLDRPDQRDFWGKTFRAVKAIQENQFANNERKESGAANKVATWSQMQEETIAQHQARTQEERESDGRSKTSLLRGRATARASAKELSSPSQAILPTTALQQPPLPSSGVAASPAPFVPSTPTRRRGGGFAAAVNQQLSDGPPETVDAQP